MREAAVAEENERWWASHRVSQIFIRMTVFVTIIINVTPDSSWINRFVDNATAPPYIVLYALTFSANLGPNTTTFILPAELFPARFRSTCHGISGVAGKFGAVIGSIAFLCGRPRRGTGGKWKPDTCPASA
ncbi:hypothetical protein EJB05_44999, partial [Eragrostis curvula]